MKGTVLREQRENIQNGPTGIRSLKTRVGRECSISRRRARSYSGSIHVGGVRGESHSVTSGTYQGGRAALRGRAVKSSEFGEGKF